MDNNKTVIERAPIAGDPGRTTVESPIGATTVESIDPGRTVIEAAPRNPASPAPAGQPQGLGDWRIVERFPATGGEADIYLVRKGDQQRIFKLYRWGIQPKIEVLDRIVRLAQQHPESFVQVLDRGYDPDSKRFYETEEFFPLGSLREVLKDHQLDEENISRLFQGLSQALFALHDTGILHLDLKPDNILVRQKNPLQVVLTDFGIASILDAEFSKKMTDIKGTSLYQSPESLSGIVGPKSDWWSLGIVLLELLTKQHPFAGLPRQVIYFRLTTAGITIPPSIPGRWSHVLKGLLTRNPEHRWGADEVRRWLSGSDVKTFFDEEMARATLDSSVDSATTNCRRFELPFVLLGKPIFVLEDLMRAFASTPDLWNQGKVILARGQVSRWLDDNNDAERAGQLEAIVESEAEPDHLLFKSIYTCHRELPLVWCGRLVDHRAILELMAKACDTGVGEADEELLGSLFSGSLFKEYNDLTGKNPVDLTELLRLAKHLTTTELRKIPLAEKCRILLFSLQSSYSPEKALDSLETALGGDREFELILKSVATRGFNDYAYRSGIWKKGDEATWNLAGELFARPAQVVKPALAIVGRMSYVIAHSIGKDLSLRDLLFSLSIKSPFDRDLFERWNNLREHHRWLVDVARISFAVPDEIDCVNFLDNQVHCKLANDRWSQLTHFVLPPFFEQLRSGTVVSAAHLRIFKEVYPQPWVLVPRDRRLQNWSDLADWLQEMPPSGSRVELFTDLVEIKKCYARTVGLYHQMRIGILGLICAGILAVNDVVSNSLPLYHDPLIIIALTLFLLSALWPYLRLIPGLKRWHTRRPFEPVYAASDLLRQELPRPFNDLNRVAFIAMIMRLSVFHPDFPYLMMKINDLLSAK